MACLAAHNLTIPRLRGTLGSTGTPRDLTNGAPCLGLALGLGGAAWAGPAVVLFLLV